MSIGENIKKFREAKGFTQQQLADRVGVERHYISMFECGSRSPNMNLGDALAEALGCSLLELLGRDSPQSGQPGTGE